MPHSFHQISTLQKDRFIIIQGETEVRNGYGVRKRHDHGGTDRDTQGQEGQKSAGNIQHGSQSLFGAFRYGLYRSRIHKVKTLPPFDHILQAHGRNDQEHQVKGQHACHIKADRRTVDRRINGIGQGREPVNTGDG